MRNSRSIWLGSVAFGFSNLLGFLTLFFLILTVSTCRAGDLGKSPPLPPDLAALFGPSATGPSSNSAYSQSDIFQDPIAYAGQTFTQGLTEATGNSSLTSALLASSSSPASSGTASSIAQIFPQGITDQGALINLLLQVSKNLEAITPGNAPALAQTNSNVQQMLLSSLTQRNNTTLPGLTSDSQTGWNTISLLANINQVTVNLPTLVSTGALSLQIASQIVSIVSTSVRIASSAVGVKATAQQYANAQSALQETESRLFNSEQTASRPPTISQAAFNLPECKNAANCCNWYNQKILVTAALVGNQAAKVSLGAYGIQELGLAINLSSIIVKNASTLLALMQSMQSLLNSTQSPMQAVTQNFSTIQSVQSLFTYVGSPPVGASTSIQGSVVSNYVVQTNAASSIPTPSILADATPQSATPSPAAVSGLSTAEFGFYPGTPITSGGIPIVPSSLAVPGTSYTKPPDTSHTGTSASNSTPTNSTASAGATTPDAICSSFLNCCDFTVAQSSFVGTMFNNLAAYLTLASTTLYLDSSILNLVLALAQTTPATQTSTGTSNPASSTGTTAGMHP